jgi:hypothetical protein
MSEGSGANEVPPPFTDEERGRGHELLGLGEPERQAVHLGGREPDAGAAIGVRPATPALESGDRRGRWPGRARWWIRAHIMGDDRAAWPIRGLALCPRLRAVDRRRCCAVRSGLSGGETAAVQASAGCVRGSAARRCPFRKGWGVGGRRSADGDVEPRRQLTSNSELLRRGWRRLAIACAVALTEALGVGPVLVVRLAVLHEEDEEDDPANDRDEPDEQPPARAAGVV